LADIELSRTGYCTFFDVDIYAPQRTFNTSSSPTRANVESFITDIYHQMNGVLDVLGYTLPVPSSNTTAIGILSRINALGAASQAEEAANSIGNLQESDFGRRLREEFDREFMGLAKGEKNLGNANRNERFRHRKDEKEPTFQFHLDDTGDVDDPVFNKDMKF
jgi:hypothetical protein